MNGLFHHLSTSTMYPKIHRYCDVYSSGSQGTGVTFMLTSWPFHTIENSNLGRHFWGKVSPLCVFLHLAVETGHNSRKPGSIVSNGGEFKTMPSFPPIVTDHGCTRGSTVSPPLTSRHTRVEFSRREFFPSMSPLVQEFIYMLLSLPNMKCTYLHSCLLSTCFPHEH